MADPIKPKPTNPHALLEGSSSITNGYYFLEELERARSIEMLSRHRPEITFWYRGLTLFVDGVGGPVDEKPRPPGMTDEAAEVQMDLIGLEVATAKSALDLLMAGTYSIAFAAVRHMLETFTLCVGLDLHPDWSQKLKEPGPGKVEQKTPDVTTIVGTYIREHVTEKELEPWNDINLRWKSMHKGAHPSFRGLTQVMGALPGKRQAGAVYNKDLARTGFENGLIGICLLLGFLNSLRREPPEWFASYMNLRYDVQRHFKITGYPEIFTRP